MAKQDKISKDKIKKYYKLSSKALEIAKKSIEKRYLRKTSEKKDSKKRKEAREIILMVECYLSDSKHFEEKDDYVNAFACLNYAHGWLDAGARLRIFNVNDDKLFSV